MAYPPGGPEDTTAPELVSSSPAFNEIRVPLDATIVLEFSEPMNQESVEENLFIVPIPATWPESQWSGSGKVLTLTPADSFQENTTYVVTVGAKTSDLRSIGMDESIVLCFTTGEVLENKRIRGIALPYKYFGPGRERIAEIDIVAYRLDDGATDPDPRNDVPGYFTQTGTDGSYELAGLSNGRYRLFAIGDKDKDGFFTENYDMIGIMPRDVSISVSDSVVTAPNIMISERFSSDIELSTIRTADNQRVELYFSRAILIDQVIIEIEDLEILGIYKEENRPKVLTLATELQENRKYPLTDLFVADRDGNTLMTFEQQPFFEGSSRADTTSLAIVDYNPKLLSSPDERIMVSFNRMLDFPADIVGVIEQESGEKVSVRLVSPNEIELAPFERWQNGFDYVILLDRDRFKSIAGNTFGESGGTLNFRVVPADTLGTISGNISDETGLSAELYRIYTKHIGTEKFNEYAFDNPGQWTTGSILPGQYLILAHKDTEGNGVISRGDIDPYKFAEQVVAYPDTVIVEPRWPIEDINFVFR